MHFAPSRFTVPSGAPAPCRTSKRTVFIARSTTGSTHVSLPFLVENAHLLVSGICALHEGFGHLAVRAHSQARTVASPPPCSLGSSTYGCRWPIRFLASLRIHSPKQRRSSSNPCAPPH